LHLNHFICAVEEIFEKAQIIPSAVTAECIKD